MGIKNLDAALNGEKQKNLFARFPLVLACSPRRGNCDLAAQIFASELAGKYDFFDLPPFFLRHCRVAPCISCGACEKRRRAAASAGPEPGTHETGDIVCPCVEHDESEIVFRALLEAPEVCLVSPIYFYNLPAQFKILIDRSQFYYNNPGLRAKKNKRQVKVILIGGRRKGENLFSGSLLTLKYFLSALGREVAADPLLLYGLDGPEDLQSRPDLQEQIAAYARR